MKHDCNVARDLMPLCIDGAASEESQQYVDEHVAECGECSAIYGEMSAALPQKRKEKETAALEKAARNLRTRRTVRALCVLLISMTALVIVILANAGAVERLLSNAWFRLRYVGKNNEIRLDAFNVYLTEDDFFGPWGSEASLVVDSSPSGGFSFTPELELRYDERSGVAYLRVRFLYTDEDRAKDRRGESVSTFDDWPKRFIYEDDGCGFEFHYVLEERMESETRWSATIENIYWIELVYDDQAVTLWDTNHGLPAKWTAGELSLQPSPTPITLPKYTPTPTPTATPTPAPAQTPRRRPTAKPTVMAAPTEAPIEDPIEPPTDPPAAETASTEADTTLQ